MVIESKPEHDHPCVQDSSDSPSNQEPSPGLPPGLPSPSGNGKSQGGAGGRCQVLICRPFLSPSLESAVRWGRSKQGEELLLKLQAGRQWETVFPQA